MANKNKKEEDDDDGGDFYCLPDEYVAIQKQHGRRKEGTRIMGRITDQQGCSSVQEQQQEEPKQSEGGRVRLRV